MAYVDETGATTGNAGSKNPDGKRIWPWAMVKVAVTVVIQGLSLSTANAIKLLGSTSVRIVVIDRFLA